MRHIARLPKGLLAAILLAIFLPLGGAHANEDYVSGELLVRFKRSVNACAQERVHRNLGSSVIRTFEQIGWQLISLPKRMKVEEAIRNLKSNPQVDIVQPNYIRKVCVLPNDPRFYAQWGHVKIDLDSAWDLTTGYEAVIVAVIDTGVAYEHPDLNSNIWINKGEIPENGVDDDANGYIDDICGWDFRDNDNDPSDYFGHGTHVAGIIGAAGNNSIGIAGINHKIRIMALKAGDAIGALPLSAIVEAIIYAADNGARVINASYGSDWYHPAEYDAISYANSQGVLFVASAGNGANDNDIRPHYPASYNLPNIISVAATDRYDRLAYFSNYGQTKVHVGAPGISILSTVAGRKSVFHEPFYDLSRWETGCQLKTGDPPSYSPGLVGNRWEDSPYVQYDHNSLAFLEMKDALDVSGDKGLVFRWRFRLDTEEGYDSFVAMAGDKFISGWTGSGSLAEVVDLSSYVTSDLRLRFELDTDEDKQEDVFHDGVSLDEVEITAYRPAQSDDMAFLSGTSMAAPHVSGLAALILSLDPSLSVSELKDTILSTVDVLPSLTGKLSTGGRINAYRALAKTGGIPEFYDVPREHWAFSYINAIYQAGITTGCGQGTYCPENPVTRDQMAAFIIRAMFGEIFTYSPTPYFLDVPSSHWAFKYIQKLKELDITQGCSSNTFCPSSLVTRDQMAAFIIRAKIGEDFSYDLDPYFTDVPSSHWAFDYIQKLRELGITTGCGSDRYCPNDMATRDQMAAFLYRAFFR
jgi:subtilisin family serine protease